MIIDLEVKFRTTDNLDINFKWVGGESFIIFTQDNLFYAPIGDTHKQIIEAKEEIKKVLIKLLSKVQV